MHFILSFSRQEIYFIYTLVCIKFKFFKWERVYEKMEIPPANGSFYRRILGL